jgi:hypothetical protein
MAIGRVERRGEAKGVRNSCVSDAPMLADRNAEAASCLLRGMRGQESGLEDFGAAPGCKPLVYWMVIGAAGDVEPV